jgi:hypothetical protein
MSGFDGDLLESAIVPQELIAGSPDALDTTIEGLMTLGVSAQDAGNGLARLCTGEGWTGSAGEAFRAAVHMEPGRWTQLGDALVNAAEALKPYRDEVRAAQAEAAVAMQEWRQAQQLSAAAGLANLQAVQAYEAARFRGQQVSPPGSFTDPGAPGRAAAETRLADARTRVAEAGSTVNRVLLDCRDALPAEPGMWSRFADGFVDTFSTIGTQAADFAGGAVDATIGMVGVSEKLSPSSVYNAMHPQEYQRRVAEAGQAVANLVEHPVTAVQSMVDSAEQSFAHDPGRVLGSVVPGVVLGAVTGGAGDAVAVGADLADGTVSELTTAAEIAGRDTAAATDAAAGSADIASQWGDFGPGAANADAAVAASVQDAGAGLAKVERDLSGVHIHPDSGPAPAYSVSRTTPWGSFNWSQTASGLTTADSSATAGIDSAGAGLAQVERDMAGIHVSPTSGGDSSFAGRLAPGYLDPKYKVGDLARQAYRDKWPTTAEDRAWLDNIRKGWPQASRLTDQELLAMERLASPDGALINTALRTGDDAALAQVEPELRNLISGLNKLPNYRGQVVRGLDVQPSDLGRFLQLYEPGTTVREPGFTKALMDAPYRGNVRFYFESTQGKDITPIVAGQRQVMFPAGEKFKVTAREFDQATSMWSIHLDDLGR